MLEALAACAPVDRLRWLGALGDRVAGHPIATLRVLPDPAPPAFDRWCVAWAPQHADAAARLEVIAQRSARRRALLGGLSSDAAGLRALFAAMPDDAQAVADIEAATPTTVGARLARIEALARRPAGDPRAWRLDIGASDAPTRAAVSQALQALLPQWLADPATAALALGDLGLAESNGALLIDMVERDQDATLVDLLTRTPFSQPSVERRRLEVWLLAQMEFRAEKDRVALAIALGLTGAPEAESPLLELMGSGYAVRLACIDGLARVGGKASLRALSDIASGFFVERALKETALRSIAQIEARLGGGAGALSMATADGRLSLGDD